MSENQATRAVVLVVDDEDAIRAMVRRILEMYRYEVVEASNGEHALEVLKEHPGVGLIVADVSMPGLQGDEMAQRMRAERPDLKVLNVTGNSDTLFDRLGSLWNGQAFLDKPFTASGLAEAVSLLLYGTVKTPLHLSA